MKKNQSRRNRRMLLAGLVAALAAAAALVLVPMAFGTSASGLSAYVVATNPGPLPSCSGGDCTSANLVMDYVHVVNRNRPVNEVGSRLTVPNAFVVASIDESVFVNGVHIQAFDEHWTPPPNITPTNLPGYSARWPATVLCDGSPPCTDIRDPAVVPGEDIAAFFLGWYHGNTEPNGSYVFVYTIHGTLDGKAVDLTASSPAIKMTG
jgi:hypothetical protein